MSTTIGPLLDDANSTLDAIAAAILAVPAAQRVQILDELHPKRMARLYDLAASGAALSADEVVPGGQPLQTVRYCGRNSMLLFNRFEKHCYRTSQGTIAGLNVQFWGWFTGPGYFVVRFGEPEPREMLFDYVELPTEKPAHTPPIRSNSSGPSVLVYAGTKDRVRRVCDGVYVSRASGQVLGVNPLFTLVRA